MEEHIVDAPEGTIRDALAISSLVERVDSRIQMRSHLQ